MKENNKIDNIISAKTGDIIAEIEMLNYNENLFEYKGKILKNNFSNNLLKLINDYYENVNDFCLIPADIIEKEIHSYGLYVESSNKKIYSIFIENDNIEFYFKYPTSNGFIDIE